MLQKKRPASDSRYSIGRASAPTSDSRLTWTYFTSRPHNQQASGHCPHPPPNEPILYSVTSTFLFRQFWQCLLFTMWFSAGLSTLGLASLAWGAVRTDDEGNTIKSIGVWSILPFRIVTGDESADHTAHSCERIRCNR